ncbi:hypothetical protein T484DRAFT_1760955 [Baffinella frigidus]|nr:hypothetical protein T484DRAFT_1760955 [Cryptophyta sp. CCMP2293]
MSGGTVDGVFVPAALCTSTYPDPSGPSYKRLDTVNALITNAIKAFYHSLGNALAVTILFWTFALLAALSGAGKHDSTDGIRSGADFLVGAAAALGLTLLSSLNAHYAAEGITRGAFGGQHTPLLRASMQAAVKCGALGGFVVTAGALLLFSIMFTLTSLGRNESATSYRGYSCGSGDLCPTAFGAEAIVAFAAGFSVVTLAVRLFAGMVYKTAEIADGLVATIVPWTRETDLAGNPAFVTATLGATLSEVTGVVLELTDSVLAALCGALVLAAGESDKTLYAFWLCGWSILSVALSHWLMRTDYPHPTDTDESQQKAIAWAFRKTSWINFFFFCVFGIIASPIIYTNASIGMNLQGGAREGWLLYACTVIGHAAALLVQESSAYFAGGLPAESVASSGQTGPGTMLIQLFGVGLTSNFPVAVILVAVLAASGGVAGQVCGSCKSSAWWSNLAWSNLASAVAVILIAVLASSSGIAGQYGIAIAALSFCALAYGIAIAALSFCAPAYGIAIAALSFCAPAVLASAAASIAPAAFLADVIASGTQEDGVQVT